MSTSFSFPSSQPTFGSTPAGGNFNFTSTTAGTTTPFGAQATPSFGSSNPTNTSGGLTLGSAGTLFSTASFPSTTTQPSVFSGFGSTTATTKPAFGLGLNTTSTSAASAPFAWGSTNTTPSTGNFGFMSTPSIFSSTSSGPTFTGLGTSLTTTQPALASALTVTSSAPAAVGLGGVNMNQSSAGDSGVGTTSGKPDNTAVKEVAVPNEILMTVEAFKKYVKDQKNTREEITRISSKPLYKVQTETESLKHQLAVVSNGIQRNVAIVEKLKQETAQELKNAEIAQRTKETPPGLQYENSAPTEYFQNLIAVFERRMQLYRQKIEQMERHLMGLSQTTALTPKELTLAMKRIHETFIAMAAQLQVIHEAIKAQKEQYMNYRKVFYGDTSNLFEEKNSPSISDLTPNVRSKFNAGPTPFSGLCNATAAAMASALNRMQQPTAGPPPTLGFTSGSGLLGSSNLSLAPSFGSNLGFQSSNSLFGSSSNSSIKPLGSASNLYDSSSIYGSSNAWNSNAVGQKQPFQLQKPPQGSKRGKRVAHN